MFLSADMFDPVNFPTELKLLEEFDEGELHHLPKQFEPPLSQNMVAM